MILHYLTLAVRNLLKYKTQSIVSILGLAVGFTCFALATMWIRYELTFDTEHRDADRIYMLYDTSPFSKSGYSPYCSAAQGNCLKEVCPEVEAVCSFHGAVRSLKVGGKQVEVFWMDADTTLMDFFDIQLLEGNWDFLTDKKLIAVTEEGARKLFGTAEGVLDRKVERPDGEEYTVSALLRTQGMRHSNFPIDYWEGARLTRKWADSWSVGGFTHLFKLHTGVSPQAFAAKLKEFKKLADPDNKNVHIGDNPVYMIPLSEYRYSFVNEELAIEFQYLVLFSVIGGLVILCALFNYLSLFITRMDIRRREMELRRVVGSSRWGLVGMMLTEFGVLILASGFVGMTVVEWCMKPFQELSGVQANIYLESAVYFLFIWLLSLLLLIPFAWRCGRMKRSVRGQRFLLHRASILFQLFIGLLFIFAVTVLMKQLYFLKHTDLGFGRENIAMVDGIGYNGESDDTYNAVADRLAQLPCVDTLLRNSAGIFPIGSRMAYFINKWDGQPDDVKEVTVQVYNLTQEVIDFYGLQLLEGEWAVNKGNRAVVVNEAAVKQMGLTHPIGKSYERGTVRTTIVGVVEDFHVDAPTIPVKPAILEAPLTDDVDEYGYKVQRPMTILIKFHPGKWEELQAETNSVFKELCPDRGYAHILSAEEEYAKYLASEDMLMKLLLVVSIVCVLVSVFGIFSLVTLSCERRRKEIAIRKVNGARVGDILRMFAREYLLLLLAASAVAFPVGYAVMKQWLQGYVRQTSIAWWIYLSIFLAIALIIALCIGWRVWLAARQNPAEVVKSE